MGGFVKETRSLHPAEGTALLTMEEVWGGGEGSPVGCLSTQHLRFPCQLNADQGESCRPLELRSVGSGWATMK